MLESLFCAAGSSKLQLSLVDSSSVFCHNYSSSGELFSLCLFSFMDLSVLMLSIHIFIDIKQKKITGNV